MLSDIQVRAETQTARYIYTRVVVIRTATFQIMRAGIGVIVS